MQVIRFILVAFAWAMVFYCAYKLWRFVGRPSLPPDRSRWIRGGDKVLRFIAGSLATVLSFAVLWVALGIGISVWSGW